MTKKPSGFTLVEMLVVIVIIMILAALLFPVVMAMRRRAESERTASYLVKVDAGLRQYTNDFGCAVPLPDKNGLGNDLVWDSSASADLGKGNWEWNDLAAQAGKWLYQLLHAGEYVNDKQARVADPAGSSEVDKKYDDAKFEAPLYIDNWDMPLIYVYKMDQHVAKKWDDLKTVDCYGRPIGSPAPTSSFENEFELWSAGDDRRFSTLRGGPGDKDNVTRTPWAPP